MRNNVVKISQFYYFVVDGSGKSMTEPLKREEVIAYLEKFVVYELAVAYVEKADNEFAK